MTGNETHLGPDDLVGREFAIGLRGYDRDEVDGFLTDAATAWRESLAVAPSTNGSSPTAMAVAVDTEPSTESTAPAEPTQAAPTSTGAGITFDAPPDPSAAPVPSGPFAAPAPSVEPAPALATDAEPPPVAATTASSERPPVAATTTSSDVIDGRRAEAERDRTVAFAERKAAEFDRAQARTELARSQEEALHVVDQAQRRAEGVLTGARDKAEAEAEAVLEDARSRLTPLLEQERAVRARLARLRRDLDSVTGEGPEPAAPTLPDPASLVTATEDDPETPEATFPVGFGSVTV